MNPITSTTWPPPLDLYGLGLLRLVAQHGNITRAATESGLTQSALTRQIQGMEVRLGVTLFERTTRKLRLTNEGEILLKDTASIPDLLQKALDKIQQIQVETPKAVRIGISKSIAFGHLPGFLHAHLRRTPEVITSVEHLNHTELLAKLESMEIDVGVLCPPAKLPSFLRVTHQMADGFHCIVPATTPPPDFKLPSKKWTPKLGAWLAEQNWIMLDAKTQTGSQLNRRLAAQGMKLNASMEPDSFDLIIHLVALGLGASLVPRRAVAAFPRRHLLRRVPLPAEFERTLSVVVPKRVKTPTHVLNFIDNILFS